MYAHQERKSSISNNTSNLKKRKLHRTLVNPKASPKVYSQNSITQLTTGDLGETKEKATLHEKPGGSGITLFSTKHNQIAAKTIVVDLGIEEKGTTYVQVGKEKGWIKKSKILWFKEKKAPKNGSYEELIEDENTIAVDSYKEQLFTLAMIIKQKNKTFFQTIGEDGPEVFGRWLAGKLADSVFPYLGSAVKSALKKLHQTQSEKANEAKIQYTDFDKLSIIDRNLKPLHSAKDKFDEFKIKSKGYSNFVDEGEIDNKYIDQMLLVLERAKIQFGEKSEDFDDIKKYADNLFTDLVSPN